jgi:hypothetical protein
MMVSAEAAPFDLGRVKVLAVTKGVIARLAMNRTSLAEREANELLNRLGFAMECWWAIRDPDEISLVVADVLNATLLTLYRMPELPRGQAANALLDRFGRVPSDAAVESVPESAAASLGWLHLELLAGWDPVDAATRLKQLAQKFASEGPDRSDYNLACVRSIFLLIDPAKTAPLRETALEVWRLLKTSTFDPWWCALDPDFEPLRALAREGADDVVVQALRGIGVLD